MTGVRLTLDLSMADMHALQALAWAEHQRVHDYATALLVRAIDHEQKNAETCRRLEAALEARWPV